MSFREEVISTTAPRSVILGRLIVGAVFLSEGTQKFLFPAELGVGRFVKIGIPAPQAMAPFVGVIEILCGTLIFLGLLTRLAAIPLIIDISVAIISQQLELLSGWASFSVIAFVLFQALWPTRHISIGWSRLLDTSSTCLLCQRWLWPVTGH